MGSLKYLFWLMFRCCFPVLGWVVAAVRWILVTVPLWPV